MVKNQTITQTEHNYKISLIHNTKQNKKTKLAQKD